MLNVACLKDTCYLVSLCQLSLVFREWSESDYLGAVRAIEDSGEDNCVWGG